MASRPPQLSPGEFVVGDTSITVKQPSLQYRGYRVEDLSRDAQFPEVAWLLIEGSLPSPEELADLEAALSEDGRLDDEVTTWLVNLPMHVPGLDALRTAVSLTATLDPQAQDNSLAAQREKAYRLLARYPIMAAAVAGGTLPDDAEYHSELSYGGNFLRLASGIEPRDEHSMAMDALLITSADFEYEPSTLAARLAAGSRVDVLGAMVAALSIFSGECPLDEARAIADLLDAVHSPEMSRDLIHRLWEERAILPGFGPRIPRGGDARVCVLSDWADQLSDQPDFEVWEEHADWIEAAAWEVAEQGPTLLWAVVRMMKYLGLPVDAAPVVISTGRVAGWMAHYMEQIRTTWKLRPLGAYIGPTDLQFLPVDDRSA
ncbi:2-methylcitrate synthase [Planctopirus limnophila DSM 3776]|uniref:citrate synthase (unknown stereospecificity) n=1 Tax=Planctopirus limnophila (strain ATCC 43296 / DSM 3776 / IFAM 1008 / Mu 290) TaxID=521674 RepID=D5SS60_PLAL2|nr:citrate/2-methylcitrate synthase [Planctopirus limnophila]ADG68784.1 2-methylcitrate synthase [Planctopirus limnophila DSM 3776]